MEDAFKQRGNDSAVPDLPIVGSGDDGALGDDQQSEADEWAKAATDVFGINSNDEKEEDEQAKSDKKPEEDEAGKDLDKEEKHDEGAGNGDEPQPPKPGAGEEPAAGSDKQDSGDGKGKSDKEDEQVEPADAISRLSEREVQQQVEAFKSEVREKMFPDQATELKTKDGELLDSPEKVMQFINPSTGEAFTRDEAVLWLAQANKELDQNISEMNAQIDNITDVYMNLKDESDVIDYEYGELLREMPELRDKLWAEYSKSLDKDPKSGYFTKARMSLKNFYETALEPYAELGRNLEAQDAQKAADDAKAAEEAQKQTEREKQQRRQDRSDIYGGGKVDDLTDEEKDWNEAAVNVFGVDALKGLRRS